MANSKHWQRGPKHSIRHSPLAIWLLPNAGADAAHAGEVLSTSLRPT
jgi:hypothetical protein